MSNIERFIRNWSPIFKGLIFICWMFWGLQLHVPLKEMFVKEKGYQKSRNYETEAQNRIKLLQFVKEKVKSAELKGFYYGPYDYYQDLTDFMKMEKELGISSMSFFMSTDYLQSIYNANIKKGYFTNNDFVVARDNFLATDVVYRTQNGTSLSLEKILNWFTSVYLKSLLLSFLLYLVRMSEWKSILGTILADKKRFFLAVFGWFYYLFKYPNNVVREVRVEAELRKVGDFFRKLTHEEKETVREVANSKHYHSWIINFRREYKLSFERTLAVALISLLMSNMLFVSCANGDANLRDGPSIVHMQNYDCDNSVETENDTFIIYSDSKIDVHFLLEKVRNFSKSFYDRALCKKIDRVPIISY